MSRHNSLTHRLERLLLVDMLEQRDGYVRPLVLARAVGFSPQSASSYLHQAEESGWLGRPVDGVVKGRYVLTDAGRAEIERLRVAVPRADGTFRNAEQARRAAGQCGRCGEPSAKYYCGECIARIIRRTENAA